jgi:hypothetical protein
MIPTLLTATSVFIIAFIAAPPVDIDGIRALSLSLSGRGPCDCFLLLLQLLIEFVIELKVSTFRRCPSIRSILLISIPKTKIAERISPFGSLPNWGAFGNNATVYVWSQSCIFLTFMSKRD